MPKSKIDATIKNLAKGEPSPKDRAAPASAPRNELPGDPNCPHCGGVGYLRLDVEVGIPILANWNMRLPPREHNGFSARAFVRVESLDELKELTFEAFKPRGTQRLG